MKIQRLHTLSSCAALLVLACGGRVDVAEFDDATDTLRADEAPDDSQPSDSPPSNAPQNDTLLNDAPTNDTPAIMPTMVPGNSGPAYAPLPTPTMVPTYDPPALDPACFDPAHAEYWEPGEPGGLTVQPVPDRGCVFSYAGDVDNCSARFVCCSVSYEILFSRDTSSQSVTTVWTATGVGAGISRSVSTPDRGQTCPLMDNDAIDVASDGFGYTPTWHQAVTDAFSAPSLSDLDPIPIGCSYEGSPSACSGTLSCPEHQYQAGWDAQGQLVCARDGAPHSPQAPDTPSAGCVIGNSWEVPANACFGPGWSVYFQLAAELP